MGRDEDIRIPEGWSYESIMQYTREHEEELKEEFHEAVLRGCGGKQPAGIRIMDLVTSYRMTKLGIGL